MTPHHLPPLPHHNRFSRIFAPQCIVVDQVTMDVVNLTDGNKDIDVIADHFTITETKEVLCCAIEGTDDGILGGMWVSGVRGKVMQ